MPKIVISRRQENRLSPQKLGSRLSEHYNEFTHLKDRFQSLSIQSFVDELTTPLWIVSATKTRSCWSSSIEEQCDWKPSCFSVWNAERDPSMDVNSSLPDSNSTNSEDQPAVLPTVLFSFVIATGFPGNLLIVIAIIGRQQLRAPCYSLILSIAVADLGMALIAAPQRIIENYIGWPFGSFMCNFLASIQELFVSVSVMTHTAIALERYRAIVQPFKERMSWKMAKITVAVIWLACYISAALPQAVMLDLYQEPDGKVYCIPEFPSDEVRRVYEFYLVIVFIAVPLFIQSWCYVNVFMVANRELDRLTKKNSIRKDILERSKKKIRLVKVLVSLVAVFQCCSIPRGVLMLIREFEGDEAMEENQFYWYSDVISLFAYYIKHMINPVILWSTSSEFRFCCWK